MFIQALMLSIVQVLGTFLTFGLRSGSKKRTSMKRAIRFVRYMQIFDIVSGVIFIVYGFWTQTAIGTATAIMSDLVNTIALQWLKVHLEQRYEAIWTVEYFLVYNNAQRSKVGKRGKPSMTLPQAIHLYREHKLNEECVHMYVQEYTGPTDNSISKDDRVFASKTVGEWKSFGKETSNKVKETIPKVAQQVGLTTGKVVIQSIGAVMRGFKNAGTELYKARKARKHNG
jgi:hypothetical protein